MHHFLAALISLLCSPKLHRTEVIQTKRRPLIISTSRSSIILQQLVSASEDEKETLSSSPHSNIESNQRYVNGFSGQSMNEIDDGRLFTAGRSSRFVPTNKIDDRVRKSSSSMSNDPSITTPDISLIIPIIIPILGYFSYDTVASLFQSNLSLLASLQTWTTTADAGPYDAQILAPAINGVIVPSISILFATLISTTFTTLRERQLLIRTALNTEAGDLRILTSLLRHFPASEYKTLCLKQLTYYTSRLIAESKPGVEMKSFKITGSFDWEMNTFVSTLSEWDAISTKQQQQQLQQQHLNPLNQKIILQSVPLPSSHLLSEAFEATSRLQAKRSERVSALQSTFPILHYGILAALAVSICIAFLMESNQELIVFLNAVQLRILWTMLIGTFSALAVVCYDLSEPFRGMYQITDVVDQFYMIRDRIRIISTNSEE